MWRRNFAAYAVAELMATPRGGFFRWRCRRRQPQGLPHHRKRRETPSPYDASLSSFPPAPIDKCRIGRFHGLLKGSIEYGQGVDGEGETTASEFGRGFGTGSIIYPLGAFGDSAIGHSLLMQQAGMPSSLPSRFTSSWGSSSSVATGGVHYAPDASEIPSTRGFSQQLQSLDSHEVRALAPPDHNSSAL